MGLLDVGNLGCCRFGVCSDKLCNEYDPEYFQDIRRILFGDVRNCNRILVCKGFK